MHSISQEVEGKRRKGKPKRKSIDPRKENKQEKNITSELKIVPEITSAEDKGEGMKGEGKKRKGKRKTMGRRRWVFTAVILSLLHR